MEPQPPIIAKTATGHGVALSRAERERHVYILGKSGSGKTTTVFNLAMHDIYAGEGVAIIDPHGDLAEAINHLKFPRLAGQKPEYIVKQLNEFRAGHRKNDRGQMEKMATELEENDIPKVADWFSKQDAPWPRPTIEVEVDLARARQLANSGGDGAPGCLSCHSARSPYLSDRPVVAPRIAGQWDYYIAKQLQDFRDGSRGNDPDEIMRKVARRLSDTEIASLAVLLSQNPGLHGGSP